MNEIQLRKMRMMSMIQKTKLARYNIQYTFYPYEKKLVVK